MPLFSRVFKIGLKNYSVPKEKPRKTKILLASLFLNNLIISGNRPYNARKAWWSLVVRFWESFALKSFCSGLDQKFLINRHWETQKKVVPVGTICIPRMQASCIPTFPTFHFLQWTISSEITDNWNSGHFTCTHEGRRKFSLSWRHPGACMGV